MQEKIKDDTISRQAAIDALGERPMVWSNDDEYALGERNQYDIDRLAIETVPAAEPETYKEKLNEIASALSEKFAYMNTCLNERDIILGYLGVKRSCETHCNTNCTNTKCESHPSFTQPEPCKDAIGVTLHVAKISKHHSDFSDLDEVIECDQCGKLVASNVYTDAKVSDCFKFCSECGSDMREDEQE